MGRQPVRTRQDRYLYDLVGEDDNERDYASR